MRTLLTQVAENELRAGEGVAEKVVDHVAGLLEGAPACVEL